MTLLKFYQFFGVFVESFLLIPIFFGIKKWTKLSMGLHFFIGFLIVEFLLNCISNFYIFVLHKSNLFLFYFYSFFQSTFILSAFYQLLKKKNEQIITSGLWFVSLAVLVYDFLFVSKMDYNYLSNFCINFIISVLSSFYFFSTFSRNQFKRHQSNDTELIISAALILQFFVRTINVFLEKFMLETQYNGLLSIQTRNVYAYFMLFALLIYTYAFYTNKVNEK